MLEYFQLKHERVNICRINDAGLYFHYVVTCSCIWSVLKAVEFNLSEFSVCIVHRWYKVKPP